jgi:hypothetical protein
MTANKTNKSRRKYGVWFFDLNKPDAPEIGDAEAFKAYLKSEYGVTEIKGTQSLSMHLDGAKTFSSFYGIEIEGKDGKLRFSKETHHKRTGLNAQMWDVGS